MNKRLIFKLLAIHLVVIAFTMAVMWLVIDTLAAGYFVTLMEKYHISPKPAHGMFVDAVHRYLIWACLAALILAVILSYLMMRRILAPLLQMNVISQDIAAGNFAARAPVRTRDEVGQLARAFNHMAESLEKIENLRRALMIDVAHELRTPLTNIRGYLEALNDGVLAPSSKTFSILLDETLRLAQLVEDVLQLAKADAAFDNLQLESIDLKAEVYSVFEKFSHRFAQKSIAVDIHAPDGPLIVTADPSRIARVLRNIVDNAACYTPQNGKVDIRIGTGPPKVRVDFTNSASELVPEDLPYIFERFYRGEKSRSREHGGAGIGLAIVKELIEAHGGTVAAKLNDGQIKIGFTLPFNPSGQTK